MWNAQTVGERSDNKGYEAENSAATTTGLQDKTHIGGKNNVSQTSGRRFTVMQKQNSARMQGHCRNLKVVDAFKQMN